MTCSIFLLLLPCIMIMEGHLAIEVVMGEYDLKLDHIDHCDKKGQVKIFTNMRVDKLNRTHFVYSGFVDTGVDIDETVKFRVHASVKQPSGRYSTVIDVKAKACDMVDAFALQIFNSIFQHCNSTKFYCPLKRWTCDIKNWVVSTNFNNIPALPYGEYKLDWYILRRLPFAKEELLSCVRLYGTANPKYENPNNKQKLRSKS